jgi:NADH-quinone oxidoreductase subunit L
VFFLDHAWLVPLIPAVSFAVILFFGKRFPKGGSEVGIAALFASWVLSCGAFYQWVQRVDDAGNAKGAAGTIKAFASSLRLAATSSGEHAAPVAPIVHSITWFQSGGIKFGAGIQIDGLAVMMMFVVTTISLLVHVYSTEYMRDDRRYTYFFAALSLFTASMLLLVVADNTLQLLVGWELVGLCSFMLIGHWWEEKPNSNAALKAFLTTRTGDIGLIIGVVMTFFIVGRATGTPSFNIVALNTAALSGKVSHLMLLVCACALMAAIVGKSGQFPLHTWLPDAMAGPTPVSALIHAATMVVAGVYLGARVYPVFYEGFSIGHGGVNLMAIIGGTTVIIGAALAFVQDDIKKVLAYSTISQLGYMVMGLGVGAWIAAIFHLFTHAFFKADLFLGAGSVSHSGSHHSFDMKEDMGGLRKFMPQTFTTFVIGSLALAGIFPLAGFWSKDEILLTAGKSGYTFFMIVGLAGAFMTAAYMTRCIYLTFYGEYRGGDHIGPHPDEAEHVPPEDGRELHAPHRPHESPPAITVPLWILSFFAVTAGLLNAEPFHIEKFKEWVEPRIAFPVLVHPAFSWPAAGISVAIAALGIVVSYEYYWAKRGLRDLSSRNALAHAGKSFLVNKYYLDYLYTDVIVGSIKGPIANASYWVNQHVIDAVLNGVGRGSLAVARFTYDVIDQRGVDGIVNGLAIGTGEAGGAARAVETGRLQWYALLMFSAVTLFSVFLWIAH